MKERITTITDKIIAMVILIACATIATGGVLGVYWMRYYNIYNDGGEYAKQCAMEIVTADGFEAIEQAYYSCLVSNYDGTGELPTIGGYIGYNEKLMSKRTVDMFSRDNCNFLFKVTDYDGNLLWYNYLPRELTEVNGVNAEDAFLYTPKEGCTFYLNNSYFTKSSDGVQNGSAADGTVTVYVEIDILGDGFRRADDDLSDSFRWIEIANDFRFVIFFAIALAIIVGLIVLTMLTISAGRRDEDGNIISGFIDTVPLELVTLGTAGICLTLLGATRLTTLANVDIVLFNSITIIIVLALVLVLEEYIETIAVRVKTGRPWQSTLFYRLYKKITAKQPPKVGKRVSTFRKITYTVVAFSLVGLAVLLYFAYRYFVLDDIKFEYYCSFWLVSRIIGLPIIIMLALNLSYIRDAGSKLAEGDLDGEDLTSQLSFVPLKAYGENMDQIKREMSKAIEKEMQSERFRNELISNISHDIRTPLTIISGNAELLAGRCAGNDEISEYAGTLLSQVNKLQSLTKDLMDISKLTTGNVRANFEIIDLAMLLEQCIGEYDSLLASNNLSVAFEQEDKEYPVRADVSMLVRIIQNLITNAGKYALNGSRIYIKLSDSEKGKAAFSIRNVCAEIPRVKNADELFERLVRADAARHTEGSGLGLPIAKSLTEIQNGSISIDIDGDIFTVTVTLPSPKQ